MSTTNTPFQYQRNANGICKSFTYYPNTSHSDGNTLISLWTDRYDLVNQPLSIKNSFISKITNIRQDDDFVKIAIIDGENEKHIFAINKRLICSDFTVILPAPEYKPTEQDLVFAKNCEIVDEFLQAIYADPRIRLKIEIVNDNYICTTVRY